MSTNIQIDVVLRKLQEQSEQIKGKNQEQREEREEEAELAQKKAEKERKDKRAPADNSELTVTEPGQSPPTGDQLKQTEADSKSKALNSTDPDIARTKEEPVGFVAANNKNLMYCFQKRTRQQVVDGADVYTYDFVTANGTRFAFPKRLPILAYTYTADTSIAPDGADVSVTNDQIDVDGYVVLPVGKDFFVYATFYKSFQVSQTVAVFGDSVPEVTVTTSRSEQTSRIDFCALIGPEQVKEIPTPSKLSAALDNLYRLPPILPQTLSIFLGIAGVNEREIQFEGTFVPDFENGPTTGKFTYFRQRALYGHYLDGGPTEDVASPAVYWWLPNAYGDTTDLELFTAEQIRQAYPAPRYGRSRGDRWFVNTIRNTDQGATLDWRSGPGKDILTAFPADQVTEEKITGPYKNLFAKREDLGTYSRVIAWDANLGSYCRSSALALGFREQDLTF